MAIRRVLSRDQSVPLNQGPHEPNRLVSNASKNVSERASTCFSQVNCLFAAVPEILIQVQHEVFTMAQTPPCSANK